ncbi:MAG TPA: hypothetical protein ENN19_08600 [Chloroflexi bacterium]|nr:hypothetical protein [Chloroflexota bacterium]
MIDAIRYRATQFFHALFTRVTDEEIAQTTRGLTPAARTLFRRQSTQDQRHALAVYRALHRTGYTDRHLLAAALLHDVGKAAAPMPIVYRVAIVLMERFTPRVLNSLGWAEKPVLDSQDLPGGWRRSFATHVHHPALGARWAQEAGCSPLTVFLVRHHHRVISEEQGRLTPEEHLLAALQAADDAN